MLLDYLKLMTFVLKKYKDHGTVLEAKKVDERQLVLNFEE